MATSNVFSWFGQQRRWLGYVGIFAIAAAVLGSMQGNSFFADPDSFYHAKIALLMRDHGLVQNFPWLQLTVLGQSFTDQHFLYHVLLIPFVSWWNPLVGMKIATVVFGASLIMVAYWFMRQFQVRWPFVFALLLLFSRPFAFRISLAKAPSTSIIILLIGLAWIFRYQFKRLFVLAAAYVWYYGGFALLGVGAAVYASISAFHNRFIGRMNSARWLAKLRSVLGPDRRAHGHGWMNLRVVLTVMAGLLLGLVLNPYFPGNLNFYAQQLINIGVINFQHVIGVGGEWYPYGLSQLLVDGVFATILLMVSILGIAIKWRAQKKQTWTMLALTVFFFVLTLKSRRYVEYYIPFAVIASAMSISDAWGAIWGGDWRRWLPGWVRRISRGATIVTVGAALFIAGFIAGRDIEGLHKDLSGGISFTRFERVGAWLAANTPAGSRIVHSDWDEFPELFYQNSHNTYIIGLDPTFLYKANPDTYWTWANITLGKFSGDIVTAVRDTLQSQYVLVANGHAAMDQYFRDRPEWKQVYHDDEATIYTFADANV